MASGWTASDVRKQQAKFLKSPKRSKYGSVKTAVDGIVFDSKREATRYRELLNLMQARAILGLRVQPHYTLCALVLDQPDLSNVNAGTVSKRRVPVCEYVADFEYREYFAESNGCGWRTVVEDVKSPATRKKEVYRLKRKLFEAQYGIQIRET